MNFPLNALLESHPAMHRCARQVKRLGRLVTGHDTLYHYDIRPPKRLLGTVYGGWMIVPAGLNANSTVYSFGVGNDISFDTAMIDEFGLTVHGFDPSPGAVDFISGYRNLPERYHFHPYGLGPTDGTITFYRPSSGGMYTLVRGAEHTEEDKVTLAVRTLPSIMASLDTPYIDILKMDIEGAEYEQIETLVSFSDRIGQLLIEFHHRIGAAPLRKTVECVNRLRRAGFRLFHVSETSSEFSFLRKPRFPDTHA